MPTEREFLQHIQQHFYGDMPRLVFADWLEEQNDPRADLLRLETAVARGEIGTNEHTQADRHYRELRDQLQPNWDMELERKTLVMEVEESYRIFGKGILITGVMRCDTIGVGYKVMYVVNDVLGENTVVGFDSFNKTKIVNTAIGLLFRTISDWQSLKGANVYKHQRPQPRL